ncbi:hypothetical protein [Methanobrevibacter sp.]|uniref:hypothetical protein n=1 Tax=Methanobrevibacter sp. TaxID=66852 RepID=UPI0038652E02
MSEFKSLEFSVKFNEKSITSKGWSIKREFTYDLIPKLPYETECDIVLDGVKAKARLNIQPRLFYRSNQTELVNHIKELLDKNKHDRIKIEMLLNKTGDSNNIEDLFTEYNQLKYNNRMKNFEIEKLNEQINFLKEDNEKLYRNLLASEKENKKLKEKISELAPNL